GGKNSLNRLIRCVCGKKIGPDPRNFNQRVSLGRNDLLIRTFPNILAGLQQDNNSGGLRNILKNKRIKKPRIGEAYVWDRSAERFSQQ
ncbi:hypothetical protein OPR88_13120, partial [Enterobacter hormaechei]|uniref:hypothetical protein n=1 Tax=Enterobacter cloacae complex sp. 2022EL-00759 TaxID=2998099 RepID=UPI0022701F0C